MIVPFSNLMERELCEWPRLKAKDPKLGIKRHQLTFMLLSCNSLTCQVVIVILPSQFRVATEIVDEKVLCKAEMVFFAILLTLCIIVLPGLYLGTNHTPFLATSLIWNMGEIKSLAEFHCLPKCLDIYVRITKIYSTQFAQDN